MDIVLFSFFLHAVAAVALIGIYCQIVFLARAFAVVCYFCGIIPLSILLTHPELRLDLNGDLHYWLIAGASILTSGMFFYAISDIMNLLHARKKKIRDLNQRLKDLTA